MYTREPNLVRKFASSIAESPPPMTNSGLWRNAGSAPSHTAHAETPRFQNSSSAVPGTLSRLAVAPVAMMSALHSPSCSSVQ